MITFNNRICKFSQPLVKKSQDNTGNKDSLFVIYKNLDFDQDYFLIF